jgi:HlyD family secretion protein
MFKSRRNQIIGVSVLLLLLIAAAYFKSKNSNKGKEVSLENVSIRTIKEVVSASGKIFPEQEIKIASEISGEITELYVKEGDSVRAGQLICRVNPETFVAQVEQGNASLNSAKAQYANTKAQVEAVRSQVVQLSAQKDQVEAQLVNAKKVYERASDLKKEGVLSQADLDNAYATYKAQEAGLKASLASLEAVKNNLNSSIAGSESAQYQIKSAQASLNQLNTNLRRTTIVAPKSGIISKLNVEKGERVLGTIQMAGTEICRIADFKDMEVQVEVNENDIPKVKLNDEAEVEVDAYNGKIFKGRVTEIANSAQSTGSLMALNSDQVANYIVKIRLDISSYKDLIASGIKYPFRPGMSATVHIFTRTESNVMAIPVMAVTVREKENRKKLDSKKSNNADSEKENEISNSDLMEVVFVKINDTVSMREVKTGIQDDDYIQVFSGLKNGETVVTGPYSIVSKELKSGEKVTKKSDKKTN